MKLKDIIDKNVDKKTLYVSRPVLNRDAIRLWAKKAGFESCLPPEDFHVTIVYSKKMFDWNKSEPDINIVYIEPAKEDRSVEQFGGGATVLEIDPSPLLPRWEELISLGAHSKFDSYRSHITISYHGMPSKVIPYTGEIILGPEVWQEVNDDWKEDTEEIKL
jgi:hypothetical protein